MSLHPVTKYALRGIARYFHTVCLVWPANHRRDITYAQSVHMGEHDQRFNLAEIHDLSASTTSECMMAALTNPNIKRSGRLIGLTGDYARAKSGRWPAL